ncbi:MAG: Maf family protein [Rickettsiales bacterium]
MNATRFILASASPRRKDLLITAGFAPEKIVAADIDESSLKGELPKDYVLRIASEKAAFVAKANPGIAVLAADTTVACGRRILGKPTDEKEARRFLELLSGRRHRVYTGMALVDAKGKLRASVVMSVVQFKRLHVSEINWYIESREWEGKAGGYAIQGLASRFVTRVNGSYTNIVGLPVAEVSNWLKQI